MRASVNARTALSFYQNRLVEQYASTALKRVSMRQLIAFGRAGMSDAKLIRSANYVRSELCVRLGKYSDYSIYLPFKRIG